MKEIDILGIHLTDYTLKEALKASLKFMGNGAMNTIFYVSSQILVEAGENPQQKEWIESMDMLLCGEPTVFDATVEHAKERRNEIDRDEFLHEFVKRMARAKKKIFVITDTQDREQELEAYLKNFHENIVIEGHFIWDSEEASADELVNEINDVSPSVIISKLPFAIQEKLICENRLKINADAWVALLYERKLTKMEKAVFGSKIDGLFYKRIFKRKITRYENEKVSEEENKMEEQKADE